MPPAVIIRRCAVLLLALLWSALSLARSDTYEGNLIPNGHESPISIVLQMEDSGSFLTGSVKVGAPINADAEIRNGRNVAGSCNLNSVLSNYVTLRLYGNCSTTVFEGYYTIFYTQSRSLARGTFRILRKVKVADKNVDGIAPPTLTISACLKTNTRCLAACPRGDTDIEYLCSNRCRTKLQTCKTQVAKQAASEEPQ
jgi:hypothetical protein